ncbi:MAG: DUF2950 family protein [Verrucomicrobia bacterium]|nr:DUF2950 family protein [Verrucomicrobiota bacterium]
MNCKTHNSVFALFLLLGSFLVIWPCRSLGQDQLAQAQRTFASPAEATRALIEAAKGHDRLALRQLFGPQVTNLLTGDVTLDDRHFAEFVRDLAERCDPVPQGNDQVTLEIGRQAWPFPIPLVKTNGLWRFDTVAGEEEIINRHIGRDEYFAIGVCRAYVKAQRDYARRMARADGTLRYAMRLKSQPDQKDGLYWPSAAGEEASPLSSFVAEASLEHYDWTKGSGPRSFHGYFFRILTRQGAAAPGGRRDYVQQGEMSGGFALVAYPVRWGESGVMTFLVNQDGVVYQRSLGRHSARIAAAMKEYNPDARWTEVQEAGLLDDHPTGHGTPSP